MESEIFSRLELNSGKQIEKAKRLGKHRYIFEELKAASPKFYHGIYGIRGIGKTVLLLQLAALKEKSLYIPVDAKYLLKYDIYDIVSYALDKGYKNMYIDEIHTRSGWTSDIKTLYDEGNANIIFTGSSAIELQKGADLSRRAIMHELKPASLREYLNIKKNENLESVHFDDLIHLPKRRDILTKYARFAPYMEEYYRYGGILYDDIEKEYPEAILNTIEKMLVTDLASLKEIDINSTNKLYKLLYKVAASGPYEVSYSSIASYLEISKVTAIKFINDLSKVGIILQLFPCKEGFRKEPKIFLSIPFRQALNSSQKADTDIGAKREEFFVNCVKPNCYFKTERGEKTPDFAVNGTVIEVSGKWRKTSNADYIAVDSIDFQENKIPLFLFGFLY
ncbi:MAG: AAA family ATPase [Candidatus Marsarchaeota archaeon]|jgi:predicted AAA+ superfamily ATPase|nr:AAA family ATPase [Candidatus Marsarchaeota archaeon]